jgi:hypothetical protein
MYGGRTPDELTAKPHYKFQELQQRFPKLLQGKKNTSGQRPLSPQSEATGYKINLKVAEDFDET